MSVEDESNAEIKSRIDYRFYSNILNFTVTSADAFIDFMQLPAENGEVSTTRIYLSHQHLRSFYEVLKKHPFLQEEIPK